MRRGRAVSTDILDMGTFRYSIQRTSPQGVEETLSVCQILVRKLNALGANWLDPVIGEVVVDCELFDRDQAKVCLFIQVTRVISDEQLWSELNKTG